MKRNILAALGERLLSYFYKDIIIKHNILGFPLNKTIYSVICGLAAVWGTVLLIADSHTSTETFAYLFHSWQAILHEGCEIIYLLCSKHKPVLSL